MATSHEPPAKAPQFEKQPSSEDSPRVRVRATGQAPRELPNAREQAIEDALRRAVEAGAGVYLESISRSEDLVLVKDVITTRTNGYIESYDVLEESKDQDGLYTVRVAAVVRRGQLRDDLETFKTLMKRKGRPLVLVVGSSEGVQAPEQVEIAAQKALIGKGVRVVDSATLAEAKRQQAREAMADDRDVRKAAAIASSVGAHVIAVVRVEQEATERDETYGVRTFRTPSVATVRLVDPATAQLFAIEQLDALGDGESQIASRRAGVNEAVASSMKVALQQIAARWLEDVDARGGGEVTLALHRVGFDRVSALVESLRKVAGVKDVLIDSTDPKGVSTVRVVSNSSAADIVSALRRIDAALKVRKLTTTRVELGT
ncbi:MAG: flagellar assembly protein T N-terminal domain-containing protein [Planctomycetota bacterium]|nr:flagellar assembly protein T N-terminal domain-containing protein [Planctomycetota bacterium]